MGFLDDAVKKVRKAAAGATEARKDGPVWGSRDPDKADYGKAGAPTPDLESLVAAEEIERVTGSSPEGSPRRNGPDGSEVDLGRHVICEWKLDNGDKFLISLGNCTNADMAQLSMERVAEVEKPLAGVGEQGLKRVKKYKTGGSEVGVTALQDNFTLALIHTSQEGKTDPGPIAELLKKALTRL